MRTILCLAMLSWAALSFGQNVGIGITLPTAKLHVYTTSNSDGILLDGTQNIAYELGTAGTIKGLIGIVTSSGSFSGDAIAGDMVIRTQSSTQRLLFKTNGGTGNSALAINGSGVGIGTSTPNSAAALDITSTTQGFLPPRMNTTQRNAITASMTSGQMAAIQGMTIYNTSSLCVETFIGTNTVNPASNWQPIGCGCTTAPATPGTITGTTTLCAGTSGVAYSIAAVTGASTYTWSTSIPGATIVSQGNANTTINYATTATSGNVSVTSGNSCGTSSAASLPVTINALPTLAGATQAATVCTGSTATINLTGLLSGVACTVSYTKAGVAQTPVTVTVSGTTGTFTTSALSYATDNGQPLTITGITNTVSGCTTTFSTSLTMAVSNTPSTAAITSGGGQSVCAGGTASSSLVATAPASGTGTWSCTAGPTGYATLITFGSASANTTSVTANSLAPAGSYTITWTVANSPCTPSSTTTTTLIVTVGAASIAGYTTVGAKAASIAYTTASGGSAYVWSVSSGTASFSSTSIYNPVVTWPSGNTLGTSYPTTLSVTYTAAGGCSYGGTYTVTAGGNYNSTVANSTASVWPASTTNWGVTSYFVQLWGGGGGGGYEGSGGGGGYVEGTITASVGQQFNTWVGGGGACCVSQSAGGIGYGSGGNAGAMASGGQPAAGGAGASAIGVTASVIAVAAGGGGGGSSYKNYFTAGGGGGNTNTTGTIGGGRDQVNGYYGNQNNINSGGKTINPATSNGGAVIWGSGGCTCTPGGSSSGINGGNGSSTATARPGGGGGGGYLGGGSGANSASDAASIGGGGGGVSLSAAYSAGGITFTNGTNTTYGVTGTTGTTNPGYVGTNYNSTSGQGGSYSGSGVAGTNGEIFIAY